MKKSTLGYLLGLVTVVLLALGIKQWIAEVMKVPSGSMVPTLQPGDYILTNKYSYLKTPPRRGDVIIFYHPEDNLLLLIKRVIAIEGDSGRLHQKTLWVNNVRVTQKISSATSQWEFSVEELGEKRYTVQYERWTWAPPYDFGVSSGGVVVLGDNRHYSQDSRTFGILPLNRIVGKAERVLFSVDPETGKVRWDRVGKKIK